MTEFLVAILVIDLIILWLINCVRRTADQRIGLIELIHEVNVMEIKQGDFSKWRHRLASVEDVSALHHIYLLAVFKNPYQIYPEPIRILAEKSVVV